MASQDSKATWALRATGVKLGLLVLVVRMGQRAQKVAVVPTESLAH